eukprot:Opistho-1_new@96932
MADGGDKEQSVVRVSKYRHIFSTVKQGTRWHNLRVSDFTIRTNGDFFGFVWATPNSNGLYVLPVVNGVVRAPDSPPLITTNSTILTFDFNPFVRNLLATGGRDGIVKIWKIPPEGLTGEANYEDSDYSYSAHPKRVAAVQFHPNAENLLVTAGGENFMKIWDVGSEREELLVVGHNDVPINWGWSHDGNAMVTSCKDKMMRFFDPRTNSTPVHQVEAHPNPKGFHVVCLNPTERILTVGFGKGSAREIAIWDNRKASEPLSRVQTKDSSSPLIPFYDPGTDLVYFADKGDGILIYELTSEAPHLHYVSDIKSPLLGAAMLPRSQCDVNKVEVGLFLKMSKDQVEQIAVQVPRKATKLFQEDLYPPTPTGEPGCSNADWFEGKSVPIPTRSLKPEGATSVYDVPESEGGKKRAPNPLDPPANGAPGADGEDGEYVSLDKGEVDPRTIPLGVCEGPLDELTSAYFRKWKSHWVSLKDGMLYFFDSRESPNSSMRVPLSRAEFNKDDITAWGGIQDLCFHITAPGGIDLHLKAPSAADREKWCEAIASVIEASPAVVAAVAAASQAAASTPGGHRQSIVLGGTAASPMALAPSSNILSRGVLRAGFLELEAPAGLIKRHRKYYFRLKVGMDYKAFLEYAEDAAGGSHVLGSIPLATSSWVSQKDTSENALEIVTPAKLWVVTSPSRAGTVEWLFSLRDAIDRMHSLDGETSNGDVRLATRGDIVQMQGQAILGFPKWEHRWLRVEGSVVRVYAWSADGGPQECLDDIHLEKVLCAKRAAGPAANDGTFEFQINTASKVFFVRATTSDKASRWISELEHLRIRVRDEALERARRKSEFTPTAARMPSMDELQIVQGEGAVPAVGNPLDFGRHALDGFVERLGRNARFTMYWMSLVGSDIFYFKSEKATEPDRRLPIEKVLAVKESTQIKGRGFVIVTADEEVEHRAPSEEERDRWLGVIQCVRILSMDIMETLGVPSTEEEEKTKLAAANVHEYPELKAGKLRLLMRCASKRTGHSELVAPNVAALDTNCAYVLDCGQKVYHWNGTKSSRMTRAKAWDVSTRIQKRERGGNAQLIVLDEGMKDAEFIKLLDGGESGVAKAANDFDLEAFEPSPVTLYKVSFHAKFNKMLSIVSEGAKPNKAVLKSGFSYVVDAVNEIYVWIGKESHKQAKAVAMTVAKTLQVQPQRPPWTFALRVYENSEPIIFQEKFVGYQGLIQGAGMMAEAKGNIAATVAQQEIDIAKLLSDTHTIKQDDVLRGKDVATSGTAEIWRVNDFELARHPDGLRGVFFSGDSFVIQYVYRSQGADQAVIYYWQGRDSSITEKGASALWTIELDDKKLGGEATQIRVVQTKEPSHFAQLWGGIVMTFRGSCGRHDPNRPVMFDVRDAAEEGCGILGKAGMAGMKNAGVRAVEVEIGAWHLHPWHCAVVASAATVFVWQGKLSSDSERKASADLAERLRMGGFCSGRKKSSGGGGGIYPFCASTRMMAVTLWNGVVRIRMFSGAGIHAAFLSFSRECTGRHARRGRCARGEGDGRLLGRRRWQGGALQGGRDASVPGALHVAQRHGTGDGGARVRVHAGRPRRRPRVHSGHGCGHLHVVRDAGQVRREAPVDGGDAEVRRGFRQPEGVGGAVRTRDARVCGALPRVVVRAPRRREAAVRGRRPPNARR